MSTVIQDTILLGQKRTNTECPDSPQRNTGRGSAKCKAFNCGHVTSETSTIGVFAQTIICCLTVDVEQPISQPHNASLKDLEHPQLGALI